MVGFYTVSQYYITYYRLFKMTVVVGLDKRWTTLVSCVTPHYLPVGGNTFE